MENEIRKEEIAKVSKDLIDKIEYTLSKKGE